MIEFDVPVVQAPMAGGPSTPALAAAVSNAGGLGFLAAGYKTPEAVRTEIAATRELSQQPFGVNVFAPPNGPADPAIVHRFADRLRDQAAVIGVQLGDPRFDDDHYQQKVDLLTRESRRRPQAASTRRHPGEVQPGRPRRRTGARPGQ